LNATILAITDSAWGAAVAILISKQNGEAAVNNTDERVRGAKIHAEDERGAGFRFQVSGRVHGPRYFGPAGAKRKHGISIT
jgi:hypothetical protein